MARRALLLAAALLAGCGEEKPETPLPEPVPAPGVPVIPVAGAKVIVRRVPPEGFEWPGDVVVTAPEAGEIRVVYSLDNPCRHVPRRALSSRRGGDTVALVVTWPPVTPDSSRKCPSDVTPYAYRMDVDDVPAGRHVLAMFEAIEGQKGAALSAVMEVTVR